MDLFRKIFMLGNFLVERYDGKVHFSFWPSSNFKLPRKEADILIIRDTFDEAVQAIEAYLFKESRDWRDIPPTFWDPDWKPEDDVVY